MAKAGDTGVGAGTDWSNLSTRLLSAIIIAVVVVAFLYFGGWAWSLFMLLVGGRAAYEFGRMSAKGDATVTTRTWALVFGTVVAVLLWKIFPPDMSRTLLGVLFLVAILSFLFSWLSKTRRRDWISLGLIYIVVPLLAAIWLRGDIAGLDATGFQRVAFVGLTVIAADAGAYFAGKTIGGPKLAPKISPNKTWAGFIGGLAAGAVVGTIYAVSAGANAALAAPIALLVVVASVAGDFLESGFKRHFGVKDSGSIFPGHGGVLDRIDSHMAALSLYALLALVAPSVLPL